MMSGRSESPFGPKLWRTALGRRFARKNLVLPELDQPVTNAVFDSLKPEVRARFDAYPADRPVSHCHPLIDAVHLVFSQHRPLTLPPDAVWLVIAQGFSHHVAANGESLRHRLARHQGRQELVATIADLTLGLQVDEPREAGVHIPAQLGVSDFVNLIERRLEQSHPFRQVHARPVSYSLQTRPHGVTLCLDPCLLARDERTVNGGIDCGSRISRFVLYDFPRRPKLFYV